MIKNQFFPTKTEGNFFRLKKEIICIFIQKNYLYFYSYLRLKTNIVRGKLSNYPHPLIHHRFHLGRHQSIAHRPERHDRLADRLEIQL